MIKLYYYIDMCIIRDYSDIFISRQLTFDEIYIFVQNLTNKIPFEIIYDADVLFQEFTKLADKQLVSKLYETIDFKKYLKKK